ncbi:hypothetical protein R3P38DRAFT_3480771 [Favolaschia claudopus]|uniref:PWWP domain-containing protein n=1 Tax=Favolaschia claudopus TaxID=2862362 RepID=A0AAW0CD00_9AGAR
MGARENAEKQDPNVFNFREIVLAKVRGFQPWPAMVVDPQSVPQLAATARPLSKKSPDYCVRFFPAGDYFTGAPMVFCNAPNALLSSWLGPKKLTEVQINAYANSDTTKSGGLKDGYRMALDTNARKEQQQRVNCHAAEKRQERSASIKDGYDADEEHESDEAAGGFGDLCKAAQVIVGFKQRFHTGWSAERSIPPKKGNGVPDFASDMHTARGSKDLSGTEAISGAPLIKRPH